MMRDFDLIRKLLMFFESKNSAGPVEIPPIEGYDDRTIKYHLMLMSEAGLLRCEPVKSTTSDRVICVIPFDLTWEGHEFLDASRENKIWEKAKEMAMRTAEGVTMASLKVALAHLMGRVSLP